MEEVKRSEQRATVEDLMYASVLEKFVEVGVDMLPTLESISESQETLKVHMAMLPALRSPVLVEMLRQTILIQSKQQRMCCLGMDRVGAPAASNSTCPGGSLAEIWLR